MTVTAWAHLRQASTGLRDAPQRIVDMLKRDEGPHSRWHNPAYREHPYPE